MKSHTLAAATIIIVGMVCVSAWVVRAAPRLVFGHRSAAIAATKVAKGVPRGTVEIQWYESKTTGATRRLHVYTPPDYDRSSVRLPVLYLLHGAGDDDSSWMDSGHANEILDTLIADRKAAPMVVVMPLGYAYPRSEGVPNVKQRADFEKDLLEDVVPFIERTYRVLDDRDHRALIGLSMGGGQALNIGLHHLDLFSRIAGFSAGVNRASPETPYADVLGDAKAVNGALALLWIGCGRDDDLFEGNQQLSAYFKAHGIVHTFHPSPGDHSWPTWQAYLTEVAPRLWPVGHGRQD
jgi:enterochelin esterase-like enzyme